MPNICADVFNKPVDSPSGSGYVISVASSKLTGQYPLMKKPSRVIVP